MIGMQAGQVAGSTSAQQQSGHLSVMSIRQDTERSIWGVAARRARPRPHPLRSFLARSDSRQALRLQVLPFLGLPGTVDVLAIVGVLGNRAALICLSVPRAS